MTKCQVRMTKCQSHCDKHHWYWSACQSQWQSVKSEWQSVKVTVISTTGTDPRVSHYYKVSSQNDSAKLEWQSVKVTVISTTGTDPLVSHYYKVSSQNDKVSKHCDKHHWYWAPCQSLLQSVKSEWQSVKLEKQSVKSEWQRVKATVISTTGTDLLVSHYYNYKVASQNDKLSKSQWRIVKASVLMYQSHYDKVKATVPTRIIAIIKPQSPKSKSLWHCQGTVTMSKSQ